MATSWVSATNRQLKLPTVGQFLWLDSHFASGSGIVDEAVGGVLAFMAVLAFIFLLVLLRILVCHGFPGFHGLPGSHGLHGCHGLHGILVGPHLPRQD